MRRAPRPGGAGGRMRAGLGPRGASIAVVLGAALLTLAGCGSVATTRHDAAVATAAGGVTARLAMSPHTPRVMKPLRLSVDLLDGSGRPLEGRLVAFDLSMPSMAMAPNRPAVAESAQGTYEATTLLSMAGEWLLTVEVDEQGRQLNLQFTFTAD